MPRTFKIVGDFWFNVTDLTLWRGQEYILPPKAGAILRELVAHPGQILTYDLLLETVWPKTNAPPEVLKVHMFLLRRVLGDDQKCPRYVETVPWQGYRLIAPVQDAEPSPDGGGSSGAPAPIVDAGEEQSKLAFEAGRMGVWEWDVRTEKVQWSAGLELIHGRLPGDAPQTFQGVLADIHSEDREHFVEKVGRALQEPRLDFEIEYRIVGSHGEIRWVQGRGKVYCNATGQPLRMVGVCLDITDRKKGQ